MRYISEEEVSDNLHMPELIEGLREAFLGYQEGMSESSPRVRTKNGDVTLNTLPAVDNKFSIAGVKTYVVKNKIIKHVLVLFDTKNMETLAILEAKKLGQMRTGAVPALATKLMVETKSPTFCLIGSGYQAESQLEGMVSVFDLSEILVYSRNIENAKKFAEEQGRKHSVNVRAVHDLEKAIVDSNIITTMTNSNTTIFSRKNLGSEYHVNLTGANDLARREVATDVLSDSELVVVEHLEQSKRESREMMELLDLNKGKNVVELKELVANPSLCQGLKRTVFKSMGIGLEDLVAARLVLENMGVSLPK